MEWNNIDESQLPQIAAQLLEQTNGRFKWMIHGNLGSGKTTLVKQLCQNLSVQDDISSPTYSIVNEYRGEWQGKPKKVYHIDLYRLETIESALDIGIMEYLDDDSFCFIEWPEIIRPIWPPDVAEIKIDILPDWKRNILLL